MTCLELDSVLLQDGVFEDSAECEKAILDYSSLCCYTPPMKPCNLCQSGPDSYSVLDQTVTYNGAETNCYGIYNYAWTRLETEDDACLVTHHDLFEQCCYVKCNICGDYQLDQERVVVHDGISMACSEIQNSFVGLNQIEQGSEQCARIQQQHWTDCCYDIPCNLCMSGDSEYELLVNQPVLYMGVNRTCGDWSVLAEAELSQSDVCKATKNKLFDSCCFKACSLCKGTDWLVNWNHLLTYEGLASTCLDVYMSLRSEKVHDGDNQCQSIQFTVSHECCNKIPINQCSLCQSSNGTYLNTNWNNEVNYQGKLVTCGDVNAMLSSEELDGSLCLSARDDLWIQCCTPQQSENTGILSSGQNNLDSLMPEVSNSDTSDQSGWNSNGDGGHGDFTIYRRNGVQSLPLFSAITMMPLIVFATSLINLAA